MAYIPVAKIDYSWRIGELSPNWQGGKTYKKCLFCNKKFLIFKCQKEQRFCSRNCADKYKSKNYINEHSFKWKGDMVSKEAIHTWLIKNFGNANKCSNLDCTYKNPKRYEWANIKEHKYRKNLNDYISLCPSCHRKYDMGIINLRIKDFKN